MAKSFVLLFLLSSDWLLGSSVIAIKMENEKVKLLYGQVGEIKGMLQVLNGNGVRVGPCIVPCGVASNLG